MSRANKLGREVNTLFKQIKTLESQVHPSVQGLKIYIIG